MILKYIILMCFIIIRYYDSFYVEKLSNGKVIEVASVIFERRCDGHFIHV